MRYIAESIIDHIWQQITGAKGTFRFVLPAYPSDVLVRIGEELDEKIKKTLNQTISLRYGIAFQLGKSWKDSDFKKEREHFAHIRERRWYNESDNLTSLRNQMRDESTDCLIIVLAGYEYINDKESLRDFFRLDQESVWGNCLRKSFVPWVNLALREYVNPDDNVSEFEEISSFLNTIYDLGLSDLVAVSSFLESLDTHFRKIMNGADAYPIILENLGYFNLPNLSGVIRGKARRNVRRYVISAHDFFNYSMFLEAKDRNRAVDTVDRYWRSRHQTEGMEDELYGNDLESLKGLLDALKDYIENRTEERLLELKTVDFAFILDEVLGFKAKKDRPTKNKIKKIRGKVPEVFLNALWDSLEQFKKRQSQSTEYAVQKLKKVELQGFSFRHDFDSVSDEEGTLEPSYRANAFLKVLLGGVDDFFRERIFCSDRGTESIEVTSSLLPADNGKNFTYQRSMTAEPQYRFKVTLYTAEGDSFSQAYTWPLPAYHQSRLVVSLCQWAYKEFHENGNVLPGFTAPFVAELFMAKDEEEAARLVELCLANKDSRMIDLLDVVKNLERNERNKIIALSYAYQHFIESCLNDGFYAALMERYSDLRRAYRDVLCDYLSRVNESELGPLLSKAFLLLPDVDVTQAALWNDYLTGAVVTPLHPAMLDMMLHQSIYLCKVFSDSAERALNAASSKAFASRHFDRLVDLSKIQWPLYGVLSDVNKNLDTNIKSLGYIHMLGDPTEKISKIGTKILLEEDISEEDDEIDDSGLFRETRTSQLICQTLTDYGDLYPFSVDGISIGAYCGEEVQPLIAGIDEHIKRHASQSSNHYSLQLTIFSDGVDDSSVLRWVDAWKERWQVAELSSSKRHYENCEISIRYRVVAREDGFEQFQRIINQGEYDVFYFMDFAKSTASRFQALEPLCLPDDYQKFPIVEKVSSRMAWGGKEYQRERILSNPRFQLNAMHAEVMASLQQSNVSGQKHVIISTSDFEPWTTTVDKTHKCSGWVVCIDPSIDELLLRKVHDGSFDREVIAFGTGVGPHGEKNFTISTEQFSMYDIERKVSTIVSSELGLMDQVEAQAVASALVREAANIAGLSVVKATGGDRFVRELIANSLARKVLARDSVAFCDELISLDAFLHWFDEPMVQKRPDLLRIRAEIVDGYFEITLQLIECKLAGQFDGYLEEAREQIESGLRELVAKFKPRNSLDPDDYERTDQRYWWMQLHRLISTHGSTTKAEYNHTLLALERLSEGLFTVSWQAGVFAIWTDRQTSELQQSTTWRFQLEDRVFPIVVATTGLGFIKEASQQGTDQRFFTDVLPVRFTGPQTDYEEVAILRAHVAEENQKPDQTDPHQESELRGEENGSMTEPEPMRDIRRTVDVGSSDSRHGFERIFLGHGTSGGRDAFWEFGHPSLDNRHILVFGASGTGKTYLIQALMCELAKLGRNTLVFDYTSGFTNSQLEETVVDRLRPMQHVVKVSPLEVNPFRKQVNIIDDIEIEEDPATIAGRVSGVFDEVYQLGDQQRSALYSAIRDGVSAKGDYFRLRDMISELEAIRAGGGPSASAAASVISKIQPFVDTNPFGRERPESWEHLFLDEESRVHIIQLAGFMKNTARLITEFSLIDLYWYYRAHGDQRSPRVLVLDEIQNLNHKLESPLGQFLTEGRKFGISLILATQTLSNLDKDERDRLFQASHKIFFKPAETEVKSFAQILADSTGKKVDDWVARLSTLKKGECYSLGYAFNEHTQTLEANRYFRVRVKPLGERF